MIEAKKSKKIRPNSQFELVKSNALRFNEYQHIISSISHELRTPTAILKSNIQLLDGYDKTIAEDIRKESILLCDAAVADLVIFLDNIQWINMTLKNSIKPTYSFFNLREITNDLFDGLIKQNLNPKRIEVNWSLQIKMISSDLNFLTQIVYHLCANALKFSKEDVLLQISTDTGRLIITIQDNGIGIPEIETEKVFNPFYRASNATRIPGCGLGLAIVRALTDCLGGEIYLSSLINQGTTFKIILPYEFSQ